MQSKEHWENVYNTKDVNEVSWFQEHAEISLGLICENEPNKQASIIDIGGGASTLVDDLLMNGYQHISVLDLSGAALEKAAGRLGEESRKVHWMEANVLETDFAVNSFDVWHDRAVFHFLTTEEDRIRYVQIVLHAVKPGGLVIVATFAEDGPLKCSGLPVMRYSANQLHGEFGNSFELLSSQKESHMTPNGKEQKFVYCFCRKST